MIASGQAREAISKCKSVLEQLGETIPAHVDSNVYAEEVQHVKQSLKDMSVDDLLGLPRGEASVDPQIFGLPNITSLYLPDG